MQVWELMNILSEAKANSVIHISIPTELHKNDYDNGLTPTSADADNDSGVVSIYTRIDN